MDSGQTLTPTLQVRLAMRNPEVNGTVSLLLPRPLLSWSVNIGILTFSANLNTHRVRDTSVCGDVFLGTG